MPRNWILLNIFLFLFSFLFPKSIYAQVVINEFLPASSQEWVEFYNKGSSSQDLEGYYFDDDTDFNSDSGSSSKKALTGILGGKETCHLALSKVLNNSGDSPTLFGSDGSVLDTYTYSSSSAELSYVRIPDGENWSINQQPTKSANQYSDLAPSPTPSPTQAPTPTPSPSPSPSPGSSLSVKPSLSPSPRVAPSPRVLSASSENSEDLVIGLRGELESTDPALVDAEVTQRKFPFGALFFILGGVTFISVAGFSFLKGRKEGYTSKRDGKSEENY